MANDRSLRTNEEEGWGILCHDIKNKLKSLVNVLRDHVDVWSLLIATNYFNLWWFKKKNLYRKLLYKCIRRLFLSLASIIYINTVVTLCFNFTLVYWSLPTVTRFLSLSQRWKRKTHYGSQYLISVTIQWHSPAYHLLHVLFSQTLVLSAFTLSNPHYHSVEST